MATLREMADTGRLDINAYGTSEGASKAWDTRGRGSVRTNMARSGFANDNSKRQVGQSHTRMHYQHSDGSFYKVGHERDAIGKITDNVRTWMYRGQGGAATGTGGASLAQHMDSHHKMEAYGTSEGVQKAWDTRGRKGKSDAQSSGKFKVGSLTHGILSHVKVGGARVKDLVRFFPSLAMGADPIGRLRDKGYLTKDKPTDPYQLTAKGHAALAQLGEYKLQHYHEYLQRGQEAKWGGWSGPQPLPSKLPF